MTSHDLVDVPDDATIERHRPVRDQRNTLVGPPVAPIGALGRGPWRAGPAAGEDRGQPARFARGGDAGRIGPIDASDLLQRTVGVDGVDAEPVGVTQPVGPDPHVHAVVAAVPGEGPLDVGTGPVGVDPGDPASVGVHPHAGGRGSRAGVDDPAAQLDRPVGEQGGRLDAPEGRFRGGRRPARCRRRRWCGLRGGPGVADRAAQRRVGRRGVTAVDGVDAEVTFTDRGVEGDVESVIRSQIGMRRCHVGTGQIRRAGRDPLPVDVDPHDDRAHSQVLVAGPAADRGPASRRADRPGRSCRSERTVRMRWRRVRAR